MSAVPTESILKSLSDQLANIVEQAGRSIVRIDDGTRLSASGLIWSADGVIVATSHGVENDEDLSVVTFDGSRRAATVIGRDPESDIAVLKVEVDALPAIPQSHDARVGSIVLALGQPGNQGLHATMGVITSKMDAQDAGRPEYILHTDAAMHPGFSGGALVDVEGKLVGMLNRMFGRGSGVALGTPLVANVVEALLAHGKIRRGFLGVGSQVVILAENMRQTLGLAQETGLMMVHVQVGGPAENSGITIGDVLIAVEDQPTGDPNELRSTLRRLTAGQSVRLKLLRGGKVTEIAAVLGEDQ